MNLFKATLSLSALAFSFSAWAAPLKVDPAKSKVGFSIHKFKIGGDVAGEFKKFTGSFEVDAKTSLLKSAQGEIEVASVDTQSEKRDEHLRTGDFFEVSKHPKITFTLKEHTGSIKAGKVKGALSIKGVTKDVELDAVVKNAALKTYEIELKGQINRKDYGITWNQILDKGGFVLADDVKLTLLIKAAQ
jgi:polyisoprenoid-binding protein YceI